MIIYACGSNFVKISLASRLFLFRGLDFKLIGSTGAPIMATEGRGTLMHTRIGMMQALNRNVERMFNPDRKDTHWGKRKLKREM